MRSFCFLRWWPEKAVKQKNRIADDLRCHQNYVILMVEYDSVKCQCNWYRVRFFLLHSCYKLWFFIGSVFARQSESLIARFMGPTWGPSGADRTQVSSMLAPWTLLSGMAITMQGFTEINQADQGDTGGPVTTRLVSSEILTIDILAAWSENTSRLTGHLWAESISGFRSQTTSNTALWRVFLVHNISRHRGPNRIPLRV